MKVYPEPYPHIKLSEIQASLSPEEFARFTEWMHGQTMMLLEDGGSGIYPWDWDRYRSGRPIID